MFILPLLGIIGSIGAAVMAFQAWGPLHALGILIVLMAVALFVPFGGLIVILPAAGIYGKARSIAAAKSVGLD